MNIEQRARLYTLYQNVYTLCTGAQPKIEHPNGTPEQINEMLAEIKNLLHIERSDVPLSLLEENYADLTVQWKAKQDLDKLVEKRMAKAEREYYDQLRLSLLDEMGGAENPATRRKLAELIVKEGISLSSSAFARARPQHESQLVGQERAWRKLRSALCSPYPQHVLLYGAPGCGKTTAARLALDSARERENSPFLRYAAFVEVDGATLRYDPHGGANPLIGSVHDPIYQGAGRELAGHGVPEPKLGLVTQAHGGVLFIDEIGEMDVRLQNMLLKVLEDKRVHFDSSYYDADHPAVPRYIRQLFAQGAPADFVLIGATTRSPEEISPALRSRCVEIFFDELDENALYRVAKGAAERLGIEATPSALNWIAHHSGDGRACVRMLASCQSSGRVTLRDLRSDEQRVLSNPPSIGRTAILGVQGRTGVVCHLTAALRQGSGQFTLNLAAGDMAHDAVRNAVLAVEGMGYPLNDHDVVFNVEGGGKVDGPSMGLAAGLVLLSLLREQPLRQDVAVTGEIALDGTVLPVGGLLQKRVAARNAGYRTILLPEDGSALPRDCASVKNLAGAADIALAEVSLFTSKRA